MTKATIKDDTLIAFAHILIEKHNLHLSSSASVLLSYIIKTGTRNLRTTTKIPRILKRSRHGVILKPDTQFNVVRLAKSWAIVEIEDNKKIAISIHSNIFKTDIESRHLILNDTYKESPHFLKFTANIETLINFIALNCREKNVDTIDIKTIQFALKSLCPLWPFC